MLVINNIFVIFIKTILAFDYLQRAKNCYSNERNIKYYTFDASGDTLEEYWSTKYLLQNNYMSCKGK